MEIIAQNKEGTLTNEEWAYLDDDTRAAINRAKSEQERKHLEFIFAAPFPCDRGCSEAFDGGYKTCSIYINSEDKHSISPCDDDYEALSYC